MRLIQIDSRTCVVLICGIKRWLLFIPEHHSVHVPWILFGIALAVNLGFIIFVSVICHRHGSARQLVCPSTQNKDNKQSESIYSSCSDVQTEPDNKKTDGVQYEGLGGKVS